MARNPSQRFASCSQFASAVRDGYAALMQQSNPVPTLQPPAPPEQAQNPTRSNSTLPAAKTPPPLPSPKEPPKTPLLNQPLAPTAPIRTVPTPPAQPSGTAISSRPADHPPQQRTRRVRSQPDQPAFNITASDVTYSFLGRRKRKPLKPLLYAVGGILAAATVLLIAGLVIRFLLPDLFEAISPQVIFTNTPPQKTLLEGHDEGLTSVAVPADRRYIISGSLDGTIRIWDFLTGKQIPKIADRQGWVMHAAVTPDCKYVLASGYEQWNVDDRLYKPKDTSIALYDIRTGRRLWGITNKGHYAPHIAIAPEGSYFFASCLKTLDNVVMHDLYTGKELALIGSGKEGERPLHKACFAV